VRAVSNLVLVGVIYALACEKTEERGCALKRIDDVERERAWQRIAEVKSRVRDLKPNPDQSAIEEEEEIAEAVKEFRRTKRHG
jgi:hypothetical protein